MRIGMSLSFCLWVYSLWFEREKMNNVFVSAFAAAATADTTTINAQRLRRLPVLNLSNSSVFGAIARNILLTKSKLSKLRTCACWSYMSSHLKHIQKL